MQGTCIASQRYLLHYQLHPRFFPSQRFPLRVMSYVTWQMRPASVRRDVTGPPVQNFHSDVP
ncbi:hypothetical protein K470DRAFT_176018 [Piedraia hortae CBS 480.64]|uniref:Uncharacterized protein n=1 Tax=Piedraia hortae CBS 480.64 TaxID=1314780 RepID=A0A6A7C6K3_9PEZI|nr:hypothetical protein K470DRAFT_176018 [Piedraia hortae CBS 480.64]